MNHDGRAGIVIILIICILAILIIFTPFGEKLDYMIHKNDCCNHCTSAICPDVCERCTIQDRFDQLKKKFD